MTEKTTSNISRDRPLWLSLMWAELTANRAFTLSFILNLSLGLIGLATLDAFKTAVERQIDARSQSALGADMVVSASRTITDQEQDAIHQAMPPGSVLRWEDSLVSMIATADGSFSKLVEVRAIDGDYPYYGEARLRQAGIITQTSTKDIVTAPHVWVPADLLTQLGLETGATLKIGHATFRISDVIEHDPQAGTQGFAVAPKVLIGRSFLEQTGLLGPGTRRWQAALIKIPFGYDVAQVTKNLGDALPSADLTTKTHRNAASDMNRAALYLNDYLGLVALVALFLAGVGSIYLFQGLLTRRAPDMAILLSLGMPLRIIMGTYVAYLTILALIAIAFTSCVTALGLPFVPRLFAGILPADLTVTPSLGSLVMIAGTAVTANLLACAPLLTRMRHLRPAALFQEGGQGTQLSGMRPQHLLSWLPALGFYVALAIWQSHSVKIGLFFVLGLLTAGLFLAAWAALLTALLHRLRRFLPLPIELACTRLARRKVEALTSMSALGLGTLLLALIPLVEGLIQEGFKTPPQGELPSLFLIDIQEDQAAPLQAFFKDHGVALGSLAPLIRARLLEVNGKPVTKTKEPESRYRLREDEESERTLNRGFNLSYRDGLSDSAQLISGRPFSGRYDPVPDQDAEISLEIRFAERMHVGLGDRLLFEVQGVPIAGRVVSLRRVQWTSFKPNFFIEFQPGVLDDAPKSLIGAISALPPEQKNTVQKDLVVAFPNITVIDVTEVMTRLLATARQMSLALEVMAVLTLIAGLGVLLAIALTESTKRKPDIMLLKTLGMGFPALRLATAAEFALLGCVASTIGAGLATLAAAWLSKELFESMGVLDGRIPLVIIAVVTSLSVFSGLITTEKALRTRPQEGLGRKHFNH